MTAILAGCTSLESPAAVVENGAFEAPGLVELPTREPGPIATDACDDSTYAGATWSSATSQHFVINFLPDTAAERDQAAILGRLEQAYGRIRAELGLTAEPTISVHLSPSRQAAAAHGRSMGNAWPSQSRYDVIYTGMADSYEMLRYGHELTHVLEYHLDATNRTRPPMLREGLAEYFDQSNRDLHEAYALQLLVGNETRVRLASLEARDVSGRNYGRAGSLVQLLIERYGMQSFLEIYRASSVNWVSGCWTHASHGCINTPESLTAMLDGVLTDTVGDRWNVVQAAWEAQVHSALGTVDAALPPAATAEISNLLRVMDQAINTDDATLYRSTMEGFYCDWGGEDLRTSISSRAVSAFEYSSSQVVSTIATGVKNFSTAQIVVRRSDERGLATFITLSVEHLPEGWRVSYGPDWY